MGLTARQEHVRHSRHVTRGERWRTVRMAVLERDGFACRICGAGGRLEVDHVRPVRSDPELAYDPGNLQALCPGCHARKTRLECGHPPRSDARQGWDAAVSQLERGAGSRPRFSVPHGLQASAVPVTIVCGPPASGKSAFVAERAGADDVVIDFDACLAGVGGRRWETDRELVRRAFRLRDELLHSLSGRRSGRAWFIVSAPSRAERAAWRVALRRTDAVVLEVEPEVCKALVRACPDRQHAVGPLCAAIDGWWATFAAERGSQPQGATDAR